jgi:hypothetical protein
LWLTKALHRQPSWTSSTGYADEPQGDLGVVIDDGPP